MSGRRPYQVAVHSDNFGALEFSLSKFQELGATRFDYHQTLRIMNRTGLNKQEVFEKADGVYVVYPADLEAVEQYGLDDGANTTVLLTTTEGVTDIGMIKQFTPHQEYVDRARSTEELGVIIADLLHPHFLKAVEQPNRQ